MSRRTFVDRAGWLGSIGVAGVLIVTLIALLAPWLTPFDPQLRVAGAFLPPSGAHWFGTDEIGRDLFSRVIIGARSTWLPALAIICCSVVFGSSIGVMSGAVGGWTDLLVQRVVDLFLVLPSMLVALAVVAVLGSGLTNIMIALAIFWWPWYARISRDEIRRLAVRPHVEAARVAGVRAPRLLARYLLPGVLPALLVAATIDVANVILAMSLMSFLGLGQPAPAAELGAMAARALENLTAYGWLPILPAATIFAMCLLANLAGDGLRAALRGA
jgi:peptide/nickel transport system permease protein